MASLWTPDGERPVRPRPVERDQTPTFDELTDDDKAAAEALAGEMAEVRAQLARTPASVVVANHLMGLYELAAIHLSQQPPSFPEASIAIDAMGAVLERLSGRLGEAEAALRDALAQMQLAFVQLQNRTDA